MLNIFSESENKRVLKLYKELLRSIKVPLQPEGVKRIREAFMLAYSSHDKTRRISGEPYIYHPLEVAIICAKEIGLGVTSIVCALLHDTIEDTSLTLKDIERRFGETTSRIINGLTKISSIDEKDKTVVQSENFRKMILTLSEDLRVILIKLADRMHNMRTLKHMSPEKRVTISSETLYLYAPLAHRLGLNSIKTELEDLALKYTNPRTYKYIATKLNQKQEERRKFVGNFIEPIKKALQKYNLEAEVVGRPKSIYSIWNKMRKKNVAFEEIYDLFAIRIILNSPAELEKTHCWQAYALITDFYHPNPHRLRDWISSPKSNGYESLHTTVMSPEGKWVEIQIRTTRMNDIAELGLAAHWKYKERLANETSLDQWLKQLSEWLKAPEEDNTQNFINDFQSNLFNDEIFVFTPKGKLIKLPQGSKALDFAFAIHSDVGCRCVGARVNHKLVPINYELQNGDQVEITTSSKQSPKESWLNIAITAKARSKIKSSLKEESRLLAQEGKAVLERKAKAAKLTIDSDTLNKICSFYKLENPQRFYLDFLKGTVSINDVRKILSPEKPHIKATENLKTEAIPEKRKAKRPSGGPLGILLPDFGYSDYTLARCCQPVFNQDIFGFITIHDGIKIHSKQCKNAASLKNNYPYRIVKAYWANDEQNNLLRLKIKARDSIHIVNNITHIITTQFKTKIHSLNMTTTEKGFVELDVTLQLADGDIVLEDLKEALVSRRGIISIVEQHDKE